MSDRPATTATLDLPTLEAPRGPSCCPSGLGGSPLERDSAVELAALLKAVADPTRLLILSFLRSQPDCAACVCDIVEALDLSQSTVSHHLGVLASAGTVTSTKRGYWTWYSVQATRLSELAAVLS